MTKRLKVSDHVEVAVLLNNIGNFYLQQGDNEKALEHFQNTNDILIHNSLPSSTET